MKKFTCRYLKDGAPDSKAPNEKIEADSAEEAARLYSERYPSDNLWILVYWGIAGTKTVVNHLTITQRREQEQESLLARQRLESVYQSIQTLESADGTLKDLSYDDLNALVENMWDFPEIRDELSPEECAVREKLYKMAFFDRNLQAGLQAMTRFPPQSGKSPQSSPTRSSEVSEVVSCLEGIHFWVKFMGVVVLISIICSIVIFLLEGAAY